MVFYQIYSEGLFLIIVFVTAIWLVSVLIKNASIVDIFWGIGFIVLNAWYFFNTSEQSTRKMITFILVTIWGLRLSIHILWRNWGKPEDFRYQEFRKKYGEKRYWWFSYFQVFLLQGFLLWLISVPLLAVNYYSANSSLNILDFAGITIWLMGFTFEAGGDWQLAKFKSNPKNIGKLLTSGFWKYTRHPNYFGDAAVWWSFGLFCLASGSYLPILGSVFMTFLLLKVSGVAMLEKTLIKNKLGYVEYSNNTSAFIPWIPKNK